MWRTSGTQRVYNSVGVRGSKVMGFSTDRCARVALLDDGDGVIVVACALIVTRVREVQTRYLKGNANEGIGNTVHRV
jgi:hypothetical protein